VLGCEVHGDALAAAEPVDAVAVDEHRGGHVDAPVLEHDVDAAADDERARVQRVRGDEGDDERVEPPDEHRSAVREVVGRRALGGRADQPVARLDAEILLSDRIAQLDQPAELAARDYDVVDGDVAPPSVLDLERRQLDHLVLACEDPLQPLLHVVAVDRGQEADPAEVDAEHRDAALEEAGQPA
jgi:hypothetical protein